MISVIKVRGLNESDECKRKSGKYMREWWQRKVDKGVGRGVRAIGKVMNRNIGRVAKGKDDKLRRSGECVMGCE